MSQESVEELVPLRLRVDRTKTESPPQSGGYFLYFLFFVGFFTFFMFISRIYLGKHQQIQIEKREIARLERELLKLQLKNEELYRKIEELKTIKGQQKIARQKLHWILPGEKVVVWEDDL